MKKSTILWITCGVVALASVSVYLMNKISKEKERCSKNDKYTDSIKEEHSYNDMDLSQKKEHSAYTIFERHNAAAQIIRETLENGNSYDVSHNAHKADFDEIDSILDTLLDEE